jgi:D-alanyl-D-alanine carboxypeptidase
MKTLLLAATLSTLLAVASCAEQEPDSLRGPAGAQGSATAAEGAAAGTSDKTAEQAALPPVHPAFDLTLPELESLIEALPDEVRQRILAAPQEFLALVLLALEEPRPLTVLVDKATPLGPAYVPEDIIALDTLADRLALSRAGHELAAIATDPLLEMNEAARRDNITLLVSSAYRSFEYQKSVYSRWVQELGQEQADRVSARAGTSQHQLGTTVDFGCICPAFADQAAGRWLAANAWEFGFSMSYPPGGEEITGYSYEPWHFRYVGRPVAELEQRFFAGIQQWMLEFLHRNRLPLEEARRS